RSNSLQLRRPSSSSVLCASRPSIAGELLFERGYHNRTPIAEADVEPHASDPNFFIGFGSEAAEGRRVKGVLFVVKAEIEHIGGKADARCERVLRTKTGRPAPAGIIRREPLGPQ